MPDLSKRFDEAMLKIYQRAKSEAGYNARVFFQMLSERGGILTAKALVNAPKPSDGFTKLFEQNRIDLTVEAELIENPKWHGLFSQEELRKARVRLEQYNYSPETLVVFTFKSIETCLEVGGTQSWTFDPERSRQCSYVVLCRNASHPEVEGSEEHRLNRPGFAGGSNS